MVCHVRHVTELGWQLLALTLALNGRSITGHISVIRGWTVGAMTTGELSTMIHYCIVLSLRLDWSQLFAIVKLGKFEFDGT